MNGLERIAVERKRQIEEEGFNLGHDLEHDNGQLAAAGACYALTSWSLTDAERLFPLEFGCLKISENRIRNLEKAGALIAAEIDRLQAIK